MIFHQYFLTKIGYKSIISRFHHIYWQSLLMLAENGYLQRFRLCFSVPAAAECILFGIFSRSAEVSPSPAYLPDVITASYSPDRCLAVGGPADVELKWPGGSMRRRSTSVVS